jgi:hypothetical protein
MRLFSTSLSVVYSLLPDVLRARLHAAWSSSALRRRLRQRRAAARRTLKVELLAHHGAFNAAELGDVLRQYAATSYFCSVLSTTCTLCKRHRCN